MISLSTNENVLKAKIMWEFKGVKAHFPFHSTPEIGQLFVKMFPDSFIAQKFFMGKKDKLLNKFGNGP